MWNEKFLFRVTFKFLRGDTSFKKFLQIPLSRNSSAVSIEIHVVGFINNPLIGTVHFLNSHLSTTAIDTQSTAVHVRHPSGWFHSVLNIAVTVLDGLEFGVVAGSSPAICFRDLMEKCHSCQQRKGLEKSCCWFDEGSFGTVWQQLQDFGGFAAG